MPRIDNAENQQRARATATLISSPGDSPPRHFSDDKTANRATSSIAEMAGAATVITGQNIETSIGS